MKSKRAQEAVAAAEDKPVDTHQDADPSTKKRKRSGDDEVEDTGKKVKKDKKKKKGEKESRKEKKDKRKDLQDLPEAEDDESDAAANGELSNESTAAVEEKKKDKKSKKEKKDKNDKTEEAPKKKSKKNKKPSSDETTTVAPEDAIPNGASNGIDLDVDAANGDEDAEEGKPEKAARHIVFVGNLPYTATAASISAHFATLSPIAVRCLTNKGDTKHTCKGIAFVEFAHVFQQRTCLDKFHHSMFDDGQSEARKINVELSAGGGGKGDNRSEKIRQKNIKLEENRAKRIEKEKTGKTGAAAATEGKGESGTVEEQQEHMDEQIHPSRRAQMGSDAPEEDLNGGGGCHDPY
ncbi:hypothetical protein LMH87_002031 [Akanthomyces muscarius]|uniref:RRM domain-containing protein n=1 Tax=Akanthomyces muscarius TaxID=2231603 RepID=A0A9W8UJ05_AKAMU|nr:hypothetical protein LMH87_002031 [Akanthomyces muscarius]KAJ4147519.1 hypothetical protein LMH87_002031 [Akanthomyces muscarius]